MTWMNCQNAEHTKCRVPIPRVKNHSKLNYSKKCIQIIGKKEQNSKLNEIKLKMKETRISMKPEKGKRQDILFATQGQQLCRNALWGIIYSQVQLNLEIHKKHSCLDRPCHGHMDNCAVALTINMARRREVAFVLEKVLNISATMQGETWSWLTANSKMTTSDWQRVWEVMPLDKPRSKRGRESMGALCKRAKA